MTAVLSSRSAGCISNSRNRVVTDGLVLFLDSTNTRSYPGSGTTWGDLSSSGLNATGNASYISSVGAIGGASWTVPSSGILNDDTHSVFFMMKLNSTGTYPNGYTGAWNKIFSHNANSDRTPSVWRYPSERRLHWRFDPGNTGADFYSDSGTTPFAVNTWYYVGVTKNGATAISYVNGSSVATQTVANPKTSGNASVIINEGYVQDLNNINCVMIYNRVLSSSEVQRNFNAIRDRFGI